MESDWLTVKCYSEVSTKRHWQIKRFSEKRKYKKDLFTDRKKKGKRGAEEKVTVTEGLAATDKG